MYPKQVHSIPDEGELGVQVHSVSFSDDPQGVGPAHPQRVQRDPTNDSQSQIGVAFVSRNQGGFCHAVTLSRLFFGRFMQPSSLHQLQGESSRVNQKPTQKDEGAQAI